MLWPDRRLTLFPRPVFRFNKAMKRILPLIAILFLAACGFQPMYGKNQYEAVGVENRLALVNIANIPDREGQILRNHLIDQFYRSGRPDTPLYHLYVEPLRETIRDLDITATSDATRGQLRLDTRIHLTDKKTSKEVLVRNIRAITSFNILPSEFTNRVSEQNARENAIRDLAGQIERQLNLYFKRI